jgi:hypothetical protein
MVMLFNMMTSKVAFENSKPTLDAWRSFLTRLADPEIAVDAVLNPS